MSRTIKNNTSKYYQFEAQNWDHTLLSDSNIRPSDLPQDQNIWMLWFEPSQEPFSNQMSIWPISWVPLLGAQQPITVVSGYN